MDPQILDLAREIVLTVLTAFVLPLMLYRVDKWLALRAEDEGRSGIRRELLDHARDAVAAIESRYVRPAKTPGKPGEWDKYAQAEALDMAKGYVVKALGTDGIQRVAKRYNVDPDAVGEMLVEIIEAEVERKREG